MTLIEGMDNSSCTTWTCPGVIWIASHAEPSMAQQKPARNISWPMISALLPTKRRCSWKFWHSNRVPSAASSSLQWARSITSNVCCFMLAESLFIDAEFSQALSASTPIVSSAIERQPVHWAIGTSAMRMDVWWIEATTEAKARKWRMRWRERPRSKQYRKSGWIAIRHGICKHLTTRLMGIFWSSLGFHSEGFHCQKEMLPTKPRNSRASTKALRFHTILSELRSSWLVHYTIQSFFFPIQQWPLWS